MCEAYLFAPIYGLLEYRTLLLFTHSLYSTLLYQHRWKCYDVQVLVVEEEEMQTAR